MKFCCNNNFFSIMNTFIMLKLKSCVLSCNQAFIMVPKTTKNETQGVHCLYWYIAEQYETLMQIWKNEYLNIFKLRKQDSIWRKMNLTTQLMTCCDTSLNEMFLCRYKLTVIFILQVHTFWVYVFTSIFYTDIVLLFRRHRFRCGSRL